ncbi:MAG: hypothetical protein ACJ72G_06030 [Friedmanniella sp.]
MIGDGTAVQIARLGRRVNLTPALRYTDHGHVWVLIDHDALDGDRPAPAGHVLRKLPVYAFFQDLRPASLSEDEVVPVPGCDPRAGGHGRYWLTATVGDGARYVGTRRRFSKGIYPLLLTVGDMRFVGILMGARRRVKLRPGSRVTVECLFHVPNRWQRDRDDLPEEWCSNWQVLGHESGAELGYLLDLEPPADDNGRAGAPERSRRTPLLLDTDYGGGPLWYRSVNNKAPWGLDLGFFPLSESLRERLVRWTAGDYHLHYDYEDDDPEHEAAWHNEGLALLSELRRELGPGYDIKFSHDLDA